MSRDLVVEIGCEEIPARLMPETLARLKELAEDMLADKRLSFTEVKTVGTPRRLVLVARDLAEETAARVTEVKGPPAKAAYDASGQPTRAAEGFARSQGVELSALVVRTVDGGQYVFATKSEQGRPAQQVLACLLYTSPPGTVFRGFTPMRSVKLSSLIRLVYTGHGTD